MVKSIKVEVDPLVFKWLRISSGWSVDDVSKRLRTSKEIVEVIEAGERQPTLRQLKELSKAFKRPLASFLLSKPIKEPPLPNDYRMLPGKNDQFDKRTLYVIRKVRNLQEISNELSRNINYSIKPSMEKITINRNPHSLAVKYRDFFQITDRKIMKFITAYEYFYYLRDLLEDMNILVFQFSMPVEDARGFTLTDRRPNIIVVNTADSIEARLFSLLHEFGHVLLGETIIDLPGLTQAHQSNIEIWCNEFASSFLLPKERAHKIFSEEKRHLTDTNTLNSLSRRYKISKMMLLLKMVKQNFITREEFNNTLARYQTKETKSEGKPEEKEKKKGGGMTAEKRCVSEVGAKFISIVANNYDRNFITYTDALNYLSIKSKIFNQVLAKAVK